MKLTQLALATGVAFAAMTGAASAQTISYNFGAATDYVFRGLDQTFDGYNGEFFGGADVAFGMDDSFYAGTWVSTTGPDTDFAIEYDLYAGWKPKLGGASLDLGILFYGYTDSDFGSVSSDYNTTELKLAASFPVGTGSIGGAVYYSDDFAGSDETSTYYEANFSFPFMDGPSVSGALGQFNSDYGGAGVDSYTTWNLGVTVPVVDKVALDVRYIGTDDDAVYFGSDFDGVVATLKVVLP